MYVSLIIPPIICFIVNIYGQITNVSIGNGHVSGVPKAARNMQNKLFLE